VSNARIDRMLRELQAEPAAQFFQSLFGLIGLGKDYSANAVQAREAQSAAMMKARLPPGQPP
jgi:hypothetical protein